MAKEGGEGVEGRGGGEGSCETGEALAGVEGEWVTVRAAIGCGWTERGR